MNRIDQLNRFYAILDRLAKVTGGPFVFEASTGQHAWPMRGVYFVFEPGEVRSDSNQASRVVRVGAHALREGGNTRLWVRLSQHRGTLTTRGGNHRGSIFRLLIGAALIARDPTLNCVTWGKRGSAGQLVRAGEQNLEREVSKFIGNMGLLVLNVPDDPGPNSLRRYIEQNAIALLSNYRREPIDASSMS